MNENEIGQRKTNKWERVYMVSAFGIWIGVFILGVATASLLYKNDLFYIPKSVLGVMASPTIIPLPTLKPTLAPTDEPISTDTPTPVQTYQQTYKAPLSNNSVQTNNYRNYGWYQHNGQSMQYVNGQWYSSPQQNNPAPQTNTQSTQQNNQTNTHVFAHINGTHFAHEKGPTPCKMIIRKGPTPTTHTCVLTSADSASEAAPLRGNLSCRWSPFMVAKVLPGSTLCDQKVGTRDPLS